MDRRGCRPLPQATAGAPGLTPAGWALLWVGAGTGVSGGGSWAARHLICPAGTRRWGLGPGPARGLRHSCRLCPLPSADRPPTRSVSARRLGVSLGSLPRGPLVSASAAGLSHPVCPSPVSSSAQSVPVPLSSPPCSLARGINFRCAGGARRRRGRAPLCLPPARPPHLPAATFSSKK